VDNDILEKIYSKVLDFASYKPRSEKEVLGKLASLVKMHSKANSSDSAVILEEIQTAILSRLSQLGMSSASGLDAYISNFINSSKPRGPRSIEIFLVKKGFSSTDVRRKLAEVSPEVWENFAITEGRKKFRLSKGKPHQKNLLYGYLMSRGYSGNVVSIVVDTLIGVK